MNAFWKSDTYRIVEKMKATGNQPGLIQLWKNMVAYWAEHNSGPDAQAIKDFLPLWQVRPYYTAAEMAPIFPMLAIALGLRERPEAQKSPARLANELKMARLPHFVRDGVTYFVVEQFGRTKEFERG